MMIPMLHLFVSLSPFVRLRAQYDAQQKEMRRCSTQDAPLVEERKLLQKKYLRKRNETGGSRQEEDVVVDRVPNTNNNNNKRPAMCGCDLFSFVPFFLFFSFPLSFLSLFFFFFFFTNQKNEKKKE